MSGSKKKKSERRRAERERERERESSMFSPFASFSSTSPSSRSSAAPAFIPRAVSRTPEVCWCLFKLNVYNSVGLRQLSLAEGEMRRDEAVQELQGEGHGVQIQRPHPQAVSGQSTHFRLSSGRDPLTRPRQTR